MGSRLDRGRRRSGDSGRLPSIPCAAWLHAWLSAPVQGNTRSRSGQRGSCGEMHPPEQLRQARRLDRPAFCWLTSDDLARRRRRCSRLQNQGVGFTASASSGRMHAGSLRIARASTERVLVTVIRFMFRWHLVATLTSLLLMVFGAVQLWNYEPLEPVPDAWLPIPYDFLCWLAVVGGAYFFAKTYLDARRMARRR